MTITALHPSNAKTQGDKISRQGKIYGTASIQRCTLIKMETGWLCQQLNKNCARWGLSLPYISPANLISEREKVSTANSFLVPSLPRPFVGCILVPCGHLGNRDTRQEWARRGESGCAARWVAWARVWSRPLASSVGSSHWLDPSLEVASNAIYSKVCQLNRMNFEQEYPAPNIQIWERGCHYIKCCSCRMRSEWPVLFFIWVFTTIR